MKKIFFSNLCFFIALFVFAETNVRINKEMYVKENLRLRSGESTASSLVAVMRVGSKVKILELGKEEIIDSIRSNWVKIEVLNGKTKSGDIIENGTRGWCFGGYLSDYVGKFDYIDLSNRDFKIQKIQFKNDRDAAAWEKLAGLYFVGSPHKTISEPEEINTPWGKDYGDFGLGCHSVSYENGTWIHGGDGEAEEFEQESISQDKTVFLMKNRHYSQTWKIDGEYLYINNNPYYKITGPDCYKRFLKQFIKNYNDAVFKYRRDVSKLTEKLGTVPYEILKALETGDIKTYSKYVNKKNTVNLKIGDYMKNTSFSYQNLLAETEDVKSAFDFMKSDLITHANVINSIQPIINEFVETTTEEFEKEYPDANVLVEYLFNEYEQIEMIFKIDADSINLIGLKEYSVFRP